MYLINNMPSSKMNSFRERECTYRLQTDNVRVSPRALLAGQCISVIYSRLYFAISPHCLCDRKKERRRSKVFVEFVSCQQQKQVFHIGLQYSGETSSVRHAHAHTQFVRIVHSLMVSKYKRQTKHLLSGIFYCNYRKVILIIVSECGQLLWNQLQLQYVHSSVC